MTKNTSQISEIKKKISGLHSEMRELRYDYDEHKERLWGLYLEDVISKSEFLSRCDVILKHYNLQLQEKYGINYGITDD
jgi:hypothetical protein